jgi:hypothetical protein
VVVAQPEGFELLPGARNDICDVFLNEPAFSFVKLRNTQREDDEVAPLILDECLPASFPNRVIGYLTYSLHRNNSLRLSHDPLANLRTPSTVRVFLAI